MKKLLFALIMCFVFITASAQPPKGVTTISGDGSFSIEKYHTAVYSGFFGIEHFIRDGLSLGVGASYNSATDYWRYGIQVNYFIPLRESKFYFSILNFVSIGHEKVYYFEDSYEYKWRPAINITPAFNYDMSDHWTIYASLANLEVGFNKTYCNFNLNMPRLGFLYSF